MKTQDFDFDLPSELIAQYPAQQRTSSRLLYLNNLSGQLHDLQFVALNNYLQSGDVMVFNDTRVVKARLFGYKASGGKVEVMVERVLDDHHALAVIRASHAPQPGGKLLLADCIPVTVVGRGDTFYTLHFMHENRYLHYSKVTGVCHCRHISADKHHLWMNPAIRRFMRKYRCCRSADSRIAF